MSTVVFGAAGFLGRRLVPLLAARDEDVMCMDVHPRVESFRQLGSHVHFMRGDVTQFDDVTAALAMVKRPQRVVNLAYTMGGNHPPHAAFKLNAVGMDNCFESARLAGVSRIVFASSLAVSGAQDFQGVEHAVTEDDVCYGTNQYATHKIFNEGQARDYRRQYGMEITAIRPANVTGADKVVGSVDHVACITNPARGIPVSLPYRDAMRCVIHVDDIAEVFLRVVMTDKPRHWIYNTGGVAISLGEIADLVREHLPDADITFERECGGKELANNPMMDCYLIDNSRLVEEFAIRYRPFRERVIQIIGEVRHAEGLPPVHAGAEVPLHGTA